MSAGDVLTCAHCGESFVCRHRAHIYCCDHCRRLRAHIIGGHRPRTPRVIGLCEWCGEPMSSKNLVTSRGNRVRFHRPCWERWEQVRVERRDFALWRLSTMDCYPVKPLPEPERRVLPDGQIVEVVWHGAVIGPAGKGHLLIK